MIGYQSINSRKGVGACVSMKTTVAKTQKTVPAKKLPGLLKKSYTRKQFEKKILKKIYVAADKEFINNYFTADADKTDSVRIPKNSKIVKADFKIGRAHV